MHHDRGQNFSTHHIVPRDTIMTDVKSFNLGKGHETPEGPAEMHSNTCQIEGML